jgi:hypothetical protein
VINNKNHGGIIMNIGEIINDSIKYPLSNKRTFLFLGLIVILGDLYSILGSTTHNSLIIILGILALIFAFVRSGYLLRIMEFSTTNNNILPKLNRWKDLFVNGLKVIVVTLVYVIPILIIVVPLSMIIAITSISSGTNLADTNMFKTFGLVSIIVGLYMVIIYPILFMSLANMAKNGNNIDKSFKFNVIKNTISNVGLGNFVIWYIFTGLIFVFLFIVGLGLSSIFNLVHFKFIGDLLASLTVTPFAMIFLYRSASLIYLNGSQVKT